MNRLKNLFLMLIISLFFVVGCTTEETVDTFFLTIVGVDYDPKIPQLYVVSSSENENKLQIHYPYDNYTNTDAYQEVYELDDVTLNDSKIILEYEGEVTRFNRLSSTIAEREDDNVWYQYVNSEEEETD